MGAHARVRDALAMGTEIGPYTIVRLLGAGGYGAVYEARKAPLNKRIALKVLHQEVSDEFVRARFFQEAKIAASLKHPHIVDVDDIGECQGAPYIAMEFLDGEPMTALVKREAPMAPSRALEVLMPVFSALEAVHARRVVHRDLKPDNIFLWKPVAGQVIPKVLDFGVAKDADSEWSELTQSGVAVGTPKYMSPEQWNGGKHATAASDQWALALIVYQCLSGRTPFEAEDRNALIMRVLTQPPTPLRAFVPTTSEALESVLLRALEKEPLQRHASVLDFGRALLPFADAVTRARWSVEFGEVAPAAAPSVPVVTASAEAAEIAETRASTADTLDSTTTNANAPPTRRSLGVPQIVALLAAVALIAGVIVAVGMSRAPVLAPTTAPTRARPLVAHPVFESPAAPSAPLVEVDAPPPAPVAAPLVAHAADASASPPIETPRIRHAHRRSGGCVALPNGAFDCSHEARR